MRGLASFLRHRRLVGCADQRQPSPGSSPGRRDEVHLSGLSAPSGRGSGARFERSLLRFIDRPRYGRNVVGSRRSVSNDCELRQERPDKQACPKCSVNIESHKKHDSPEVPELDASKAQLELGITFRPVEESLTDMAKRLVELGIVKSKL